MLREMRQQVFDQPADCEERYGKVMEYLKKRKLRDVGTAEQFMAQALDTAEQCAPKALWRE
jgi:hypothetical protein